MFELFPDFRLIHVNEQDGWEVTRNSCVQKVGLHMSSLATSLQNICLPLFYHIWAATMMCSIRYKIDTVVVLVTDAGIAERKREWFFYGWRSVSSM
jgi:hypothetical protein